MSHSHHGSAASPPFTLTVIQQACCSPVQGSPGAATLQPLRQRGERQHRQRAQQAVLQRRQHRRRQAVQARCRHGCCPQGLELGQAAVPATLHITHRLRVVHGKARPEALRSRQAECVRLLDETTGRGLHARSGRAPGCKTQPMNKCVARDASTPHCPAALTCPVWCATPSTVMRALKRREATPMATTPLMDWPAARAARPVASARPAQAAPTRMHTLRPAGAGRCRWGCSEEGQPCSPNRPIT